MRAGEIVTSVRNMAKKQAPSRSTVCLSDLVSKSLVMLEPELRQKGVTPVTESKPAANVCIIDDDLAVSSSLVAVVQTIGCSVTCFASAEEFLKGTQRPAPTF